jgi:hypothetical protein
VSPQARLIAYVDGELAPREAARFEAEMAADPALAAAVAAHRALAARLGGAYAPILDEPVPARLLACAQAANDAGGRRRAGLRLPPWAALAATLALGVLAGRLIAVRPPPALAEHGGALVAQGRLDAALSHGLASDGGPVKVALTFRSADGRYCRTFESAPDGLAGLACREGGRWIVRTVTAWRPPAATAYRTAGDGAPPEVLATVDATISGDALGPAAERAARDRGWR